MTYPEALAVVEMIINAFPQAKAMTVEQIDMYAKGIQDLSSSHAFKAVVKAQKQSSFRPSVKDFREFVRIEEKLDLGTRSADEEWGRRSKLAHSTPEWCDVWAWMRFKQRDFRTLPQQIPGFYDTPPKTMSKDDYDEARKGWFEDGAPKFTIEILDAMVWK